MGAPKGQIGNPTGKGGFGDHPEHRSPGGWSKEHTISYQYKRYLAMPDSEFKEAAKEDNRTMAMTIAYNRVKEARESLPDVKEISERTEGKAPQSVDVTSGGEPIKTSLVEFVGKEQE